MKKTLFGLVVIIAALVLVACGSDKNKEEVEEKDLYAMSVVGSINDINIQSMGLFSRNEINEIENKEHLELMLNMLNDETYTSELVESDKEEFEYLLKIELNGELYSYYYNEELLKSEIEEDEDEFEEEKEFRIDGLILVGDLEYTVKGFKTIETEEDTKDGEFQDELELELKISLNEDNYSIIKYEVENETDAVSKEEEKELKFKTYVDGKKVSEMEIDFEVENDKTEIKLELKEGNNEYKYKFKNKSEKQAIIEFEIKTSEKTEKGKINVNIVVDEMGNIRYEF